LILNTLYNFDVDFISWFCGITSDITTILNYHIITMKIMKNKTPRKIAFTVFWN
jgi:hypothetical protein